MAICYLLSSIAIANALVGSKKQIASGKQQKNANMKLLNSLLCLLFLSIYVSASANGIDSLDIPSYITHHQLDAKDDGNGIYYSFEKKGKGALPKPGDYVKINYIGKMLDGSAFDQSDPNDPFVFRIGYRIVIQGWDKGIQKLPVGSKATLLLSLIHI